MNRRARIVYLALIAAVGCTELRAPGPTPPRPTRFEHAHFDRVLRRVVDPRGGVDYAGLAADRHHLDAYLRLVAAYGPDNAPELFPTRDDRLAYWLNAYNAAVLLNVLAHHPIDSVLDVNAPYPVQLVLPRGAGFFAFRQIPVGGALYTLYDLERDVIRERFGEPRIHFALNCASCGCPRLRRQAFRGAELSQQLDDATREFMADARNVRIDLDARVLHVSALFDWFTADFVHWLERTRPERPASVPAYVALYAPPDVAAILQTSALEVAFIPWDWRLNGPDGCVPPRP